jgi:hypothetical protein
LTVFLGNISLIQTWRISLQGVVFVNIAFPAPIIALNGTLLRFDSLLVPA